MILKSLVKFSFYFLVAFISLQALAQQEPESVSKTPIIVPPPPNSASLGLYGQVPLNQFTGNGIISIPLHTITSGNLELPISLSYSSDGVKIDQYESNVGMGWVLNAGGVITRQVFDYQDNYNGKLQKPNAAYDSTEMATFLEQASNAGEVDTQPDIYSYNFGGISGKFFLDDNNIPVEIEPTGIKIEITDNFLGIGTIGVNTNPEVIITDTKGIKYFFGGSGAVESSLVRDLSKQGPRAKDVKTSWYLTKIVDPTTNKEIILKYDGNPFNVEYLSGLEQTLEYKDDFHPWISLTSTKYNSFSNESLLKEIISNDTKITFTYSKRFSDNDFNLMKIDEINCYDKQDILVNKIKLSYTEYVGNSYPNENYLPYEIRTSPNYLTKRFYLTKVSEHSNSINPKFHELEYYSPELLPARFSFAKDHYGLFNGKNNTTLITSDVSVPTSVRYPISSSYTELANRTPDSNFGYFGLLKKITYPTKGTSTLVYEPHVNGKVTVPVFPSKALTKIDLATRIGERNDSKDLIISSSYKQTIKLNTYAQFNSFCRDQDPTYEPTHDPSGTIYITDLSTNTRVTFMNHEDTDFPVDLGDYYNFNQDSPSSDYITFELNANTNYRVEVKLMSAECVMAGISFDYYSDPVTFKEEDVQVGGFRIQKVLKDNLFNGLIETEKYFYGSGAYMARAAVAYVRNINRSNLCEYPSQSFRHVISSADLASIYSCQNAQFGYAGVTKSYGENFENGGEEFIYNIIQDQMPFVIQGEDDRTTPFTNGFGSGRLINHKVFKKNSSGINIVLKETINEYVHDISKDKSVLGHVAYMSNELFAHVSTNDHGIITTFCPQVFPSGAFSLNEYSVRSQWSYLNKTIEKSFDKNGENPIIVETNYTYSNPLHCQPTSIVSKSSKGETLETKYYYAQDSEMSGQPFVNDLRTANIILPPLNTKSFSSGSKISEQLRVYDKSAATSNLLLPKSVYINKGSAAINLSSDRKLTYDLYDDKGNILQYTPEGGIPVSIIWGYNKTQPIAKIENMVYASIPAETITNLQTLSNSDKDNCMSEGCNEQKLRKALNLFRDSLPNAFVSTYTYNPLVGVTSITDPKGFSSYYEYDGEGRLRFVKDKDLNVLQKYCYNYKGQTIDCDDNSSTSVVLYNSTSQSGSFTKNDCTAGGSGSTVSYNQVAGAVTSTVSQADADSKGLAKFNADGQAYANSNGSCTYYSVAQSGLFVKNNCASGGSGSAVSYSQIAGVETSAVSQADADSKGLAKFNADGQANANAYGGCTFSSIAYSGMFTRNNCAAGGVGSSVSYSQAIGAETSTVSQADADSKGLVRFNADGQANANVYGSCTFNSIAYNGTFTKNNCPTGGVGSSVSYSQVVGASMSLVSQADADSKGLAKFNADGQAYANSNGSCTYYSVARSGLFVKNNCASGGSGSTVSYNQVEGAVTSTVSQADANASGLTKFNIDGQNYANANGVCTFYSIAINGSSTKKNCPAGGTGSMVPYSQPAGAITSTVSQAEADSLALSKFYTDAQANANVNGYCTFYSVPLSRAFTKNNCAPGGTGSSVTYNQEAGASVSTNSQAEADALGLAKFNTDGQAYANSNGYCTYYSIAYSGTFMKNNCPSGGFGSTVAYSQAAGFMTSTNSQADADALGLYFFNANGQSYANANGNCTFYSAAQNGSFTKNNCLPGGTGSSMGYTQNWGEVSSTVSQAEANSLGLTKFNTDGQAYVNANGYCTYYSAPFSGTFTKNNCNPGGVGSSLTYSQAAGVKTSTNSQAEADALGYSQFIIDGQAYVNANTRCTFYNAATSKTFFRNNCPANSDPGTFTYSVPYGEYTSNLSQRQADQQAQDAIDLYGQNAANLEATCTFYSSGLSAPFTRNNCGPGYIGGSYTYTVPTGAYLSTISQADADNKASAQFVSNGQAYANSVGTCTAIPQPVTFTYEYLFSASAKQLYLDIYASTGTHAGATLYFNITYVRLLGTQQSTQSATVVFEANTADKTVIIPVNAKSIVSVTLTNFVRN